MNSRREAAFAVAKWIATKGHLSDMLPEGPDRAFVQDLAYTTVRRFRTLRSVLGRLVKKWPKGEMEALLLVGAAQILYMPEVPDFAAVNETVSAAKKCPNPNVAKVVNGVLRNLIRKRDEFMAELATAPLAERESYPNSLVKRWIERFGEADAERLCKWHNEPAETWLARKPGAAESFERLARGKRVSEAEGYLEGDFIVQDPATAAAVELLDVKPGLKVLDLCAAPGGKSIQTAWRLEGGRDGGRLVSMEVNPSRRRRLAENLKRVKLDWVEAVAAVPEGELFDRVLADVPCSNTGVLRRRPDARWRWTDERLAELAELQATLLAKAASHVAPGGILVYSTCSCEPEENSCRVEKFLAENGEFEKIGERESVPFLTGHDGAYACSLRRKG